MSAKDDLRVGRTSGMLTAAKVAAANGQRVVVVMANSQEAERAKRALAGTSVDVRIHGENLLGMRCAIMFDHFAVETMHAEAASLRARIAELEAQRDEARRFAGEAAKRYNDLLASGPTLTCAFCGQEYPKGTPPTQHEALTAHVRVCEKHPLAQKIAELEAQVRERDEALKLAREALEYYANKRYDSERHSDGALQHTADEALAHPLIGGAK